MPRPPAVSAPRSSTYQMLDKLAGGRLAERIIELRATGLSWEATARKLHAEFEITVTGETLRSWDKSTKPAKKAS